MQQATGRESSCHTVCKEYSFWQSSSTNLRKPEDFVSWCSTQGVSLIVRLNFGHESGLKQLGGSYSSETIKKYGISHIDLPALDHRGGLPDVASMQTMLEECQRMEGKGPILMHC